MKVDAINLEKPVVAGIYSSWLKSDADPLGSMDLRDIIKLLNVTSNKISLLWLLKRSDWYKILYLLPKNLLIAGLSFFDKDKLMALILRLPPQYVIKMLLYLFSPEKLVQRMPMEDLFRILKAPEMNHRRLLKGMQNMEPRFLHQLLSYIYGGDQSKYAKMKEYEKWQLFFHADKRKLIEGFKTLQFKALMPFVTGFVKEDTSLLQNVSLNYVCKMFEGLSKGDLTDACNVLPEELLIRMLGQLPDKMLVQVAGQIDDKMFSDYLFSNQANLLRSLAAA